MNDSDDPIHIPLVDREAGMAGLRNHLDDLGKTCPNLNPYNLGTWNHNLANTGHGKIKNPMQHATLFLCDNAGIFTKLYNRTNFVLRDKRNVFLTFQHARHQA